MGSLLNQQLKLYPFIPSKAFFVFGGVEVFGFRTLIMDLLKFPWFSKISRDYRKFENTVLNPKTSTTPKA